MFDIMKVAANIKEARIAQNMTQMSLADAMEVSYQAVSNWERGNSMPDIAKLEQLCQILQISFAQLFGAENESLTIAKVTGKDESSAITLEEIKELAPLLSPRKIKQLLEHNRRLDKEESAQAENKIDCSVLIGLAPFLEQEDLENLAAGLEGEINPEDLISLAPFLGRNSLDKLSRNLTGEADIEIIMGLAPFLSEKGLSNLLQHYQGNLNWEHIMSLAPFLGQDSLKNLLLSNQNEN